MSVGSDRSRRTVADVLDPALLSEPVLLSDVRVSSVPVDPVDEPLVDLRTVSGLRLNDLYSGDGSYVYVRKALAERLASAQEALPAGYAFMVYEGLRPQHLQELYFETYRADLLTSDPTLSDDECFRLTSRFTCPPDIAPHVSGAALDLTLCDGNGNELDLGTPINATPETSRGACYTAAAVDDSARRNRDVMGTALRSAGFVNYPTEWWHWSYGDRYWAWSTGAEAALYGPVTLGWSTP